MSLNLQSKKDVVAAIALQVAQSQTLVLAEYRGTAVGDMTKLRSAARAKGVYLRVLKNTLARRAVQGTPFEVATKHMVGPLIYGFSKDAVAAAKVVNEFAKGNEKFVIKAGAYNGKVLDKAAVQALANIPTKEVLLAQLLGLMQSPISGLARVLVALGAKKFPPPAESPATPAAA